MKYLDRLGLAQRIILVVASALLLGTVGVYVSTLGTPTANFGWFGYAPLSGGIHVVSDGPDLTAWQQLLVWIGLILVWAVGSVVVLKPRPNQENDQEPPPR